VSKLIKATSSPLSSIFGSGFLVIVPILAGAVGAYSVIAMIAICAIAYAVGSVIRFNIKHAEPILAKTPGEAMLSFERSSDLALILAYVISVCLYLHILSSFVLGGLNIDSDLNNNILTTAILVIITAIGLTKGLDLLDVLEAWGLYITLIIIALIIVGFAYYDWTAWQSPTGIKLSGALSHTPWEVITIVAGTLIVVQGFETPRYLGNSFDAGIRITASRWSQIISASVYIVFVTAAMPIVHTLNGKYDDNSLIALVGVGASVLAVPLIIAAALSQFSAAVADTHAATGNMQEVTNGHLKSKWGCVLVGGGAIALTWSAATLEILALASRAFAFYYLLQCMVAICINKSPVQRFAIAIVSAILAFITIFAVPAG
jgi:hypothetical protein